MPSLNVKIIGLVAILVLLVLAVSSMGGGLISQQLLPPSEVGSPLGGGGNDAEGVGEHGANMHLLVTWPKKGTQGDRSAAKTKGEGERASDGARGDTEMEGEHSIYDAASTAAKGPAHPTDRYLLDPATGQLKGNGRCIVPLLLTDAKYHGTRLLSTTLKGWVHKLLLPQSNLDLVLYYDMQQAGLLEGIVKMLSLVPSAGRSDGGGGGELATAVRPDVYKALPESDRALLAGSGGYFTTPHHATFALRILPTIVAFPRYIQTDPWLLNKTEWLRCGCPPYCPTKRATVSYVQGTRWYTYDLFLEPVVAAYSYWMKVDVDIWVFREMNINFVDAMREGRALVGHTGSVYNGHGCSNDLHRAILEYYGCPYEGIARQDQGRRTSICTEGGRIASANSSWWKQDDGVYYTNFVVYSVHFFLDKDVMALSLYLNEYRDGFFRWRWTDQSLAHKVFGVFVGPDEDTFRLDWSHLRWKKNNYRPHAAFWHGKSAKTRKDLSKFTKL